MALQMNATFLKVLQEVLSGLLVMELNVKRGNQIRRRRLRTKRFPSWSGFTRFGCHGGVYPRERKRERRNITQSQPEIKKRKEKTYT